MTSSLHFFGGKGGVGKTTCAAAFACGLAAKGQRVLLASTDPACSLGDVLQRRLGPAPRRIAPGLRAVQPDPPAAFARWREAHRGTLKALAERGTYFDAADLDGFLELTLPGVDELFGLVELARLIDAEEADAVVVDTAPTGHTLRLFSSPDALAQIARLFAAMQEKHHVLSEGLRGFRAADEGDDLIDWVADRAAGLGRLLHDPQTRVHWIALPEALALEEAGDGVRALAVSGIRVEELVVNRLCPPPPRRCRGCSPRVAAEKAALAQLPAALRPLPLRTLPALEKEPVGVASLVRLASALQRKPVRRTQRSKPPARKPSTRGAVAASDAAFPLPLPASLQVLFLGGKGGVGKSTASVAAAMALASARPDREVLLLSVDPAHSLGDALAQPVGDLARRLPGLPRNLRVRELDAGQALERERAHIEEAIHRLFDRLRGGSRFDAAYDRAIFQALAELQTPGVDEVFGVLEVIDALGPGGKDAGAAPLLVIDTAPTAHALRLLELPKVAHGWVKGLLKLLLDYRGAIGLGPLAEELLGLSQRLGALQRLWTDPARTAFVAVTRPAQLPSAELSRLRRSLRALEVPFAGVIANALTTGTCARCTRARREERRSLDELRRLTGRRAAIILAPSVAPPPRGAAPIAAWSRLWAAG